MKKKLDIYNKKIMLIIAILLSLLLLINGITYAYLSAADTWHSVKKNTEKKTKRIQYL